VPTDLLVIQHADISPPGLIEEITKTHERVVHIIRPDKEDTIPPSPDDVWAVIVLGGGMAAWDFASHSWLAKEIRLLKQCIAGDTPTLGICLGAQLLARAAESKNYKGGMPEIGWYPIDVSDEGKKDPLFAGLPAQPTFFQWHTDTFDLPHGAELLASSRLFPNQAFRIGKRVYGVQFHPEKTGPIIERQLDALKPELDAFRGVIDPARIRREGTRVLPKAAQNGRRLLENFLGIAWL